MKFKILFLCFFFSVLFVSKAQDKTPPKTWYEMSGTDLIFSSGELQNNGENLEKVTRFSAFFHINHQDHYDFNRSVGFYTGLSLVNVGMIHQLPLNSQENVLLKQRGNSLGLPLAFKFGNMEKRTYFALGGYIEWMFNFKRKLIYNDVKSKEEEWFSGQVNAFQPSLFAEIHFTKGFYIRLKYYLNDFLKDSERTLNVPGSADQINFRPTSSRMAYLSTGWILKVRKKRKATKSDV